MFADELVVIGVHSAKFPTEQETENIRQAVMRLGIEHPVVNDAGFKTWNAYAVRAWPTLVLVDPTGRIAGEVSGEIQAEAFAASIQEVIDQHADAVNRAPLDLRADAAAEPRRPLRYPSRLLLAEDRLFVADTGHHRILEIALDADGLGGDLLRVIGSGQPGLRDGPADAAAFHHPHGLGLRGSPTNGTLYVADTENHAVRAIDLASGAVSTLAGTGAKAHGRPQLAAPLEMPLRSPWAVLPLESYLLIAMAGSHQIWVLTGDGQIGPFAGNGNEALVDGPVAESSFNQPSDIAFGMGYLFVADPEASAVRAISLMEEPRTVTLVGQGLFDFGDVDGATSAALLQHPAGIAVEGERVYVADTYNNKIKLLEPAVGQVNTLIGDGRPGWQDGPFETARLFEPEGVHAHADRLYIADTNNHLLRVADLRARQVTTFRLRGVERLPLEQASAPEPQRLPEITVAPGTVRLTLDVRLPEGYKRNPDAPTMLALGREGSPERRSYAADEPLTWTMEIGEDQNLPLNLTLYYCQAEEAQLCLIHDQRLLIPLVVKSGGLVEARIPWEVALAAH